MKKILLAVTCLVGSSVAIAYGSLSNYGYQDISILRFSRSTNKPFNCVATAQVQKGQETYNHEISIDGVIDVSRRTLGGDSVGVSVNNRYFAKFNLPQHSIWVKDGEIVSLSIRGETAKGEILKLYYAGEGNEAQNRVQLSRGRHTLWTKNVSCALGY